MADHDQHILPEEQLDQATGGWSTTDVRRHAVGPNETLDSIAAMYHVHKLVIAALNDLRSEVLYVGQVLRIPAGEYWR